MNTIYISVTEWLTVNKHNSKRSPFYNCFTRAVRIISSHFEHLETQSRGLDVSWRPVSEQSLSCGASQWAVRCHWLSLCGVWPLHSQISSLSTAILALGKTRSRRKPNLGCRGADRPEWCNDLPKKPARELQNGQPHDRRPTYNGVRPGSPRGSLTTLLSLSQCHAAFSTIPPTLAWVDQSPVSVCHSKPHQGIPSTTVTASHVT